MKTNLHQKIIGIVLVAMGLGLSARAAELTAYQLIKEGNRYVSEDAKDKIVQIRSDKSVGTMVPNIWYIVYFDPDATFKATEVKFGAGQKMEVKRPTRMLEFGTADEKKLDRKKMNVDSDKALAIAIKDPLLTNLKLTSSQFWLQRSDDGPVWKIRLWAAKVRNPNADADIGDMYILAEDGKVMRRDLHIDKAN